MGRKSGDSEAVPTLPPPSQIAKEQESRHTASYAAVGPKGPLPIAGSVREVSVAIHNRTVLDRRLIQE